MGHSKTIGPKDQFAPWKRKTYPNDLPVPYVFGTKLPVANIHIFFLYINIFLGNETPGFKYIIGNWKMRSSLCNYTKHIYIYVHLLIPKTAVMI